MTRGKSVRRCVMYVDTSPLWPQVGTQTVNYCWNATYVRFIERLGVSVLSACEQREGER